VLNSFGSCPVCRSVIALSSLQSSRNSHRQKGKETAPEAKKETGWWCAKETGRWLGLRASVFSIFFEWIGDWGSEISATPTTAGRINIPSWPLLFAYICMQIRPHIAYIYISISLYIYTLEHLKCWITVVVSFLFFSPLLVLFLLQFYEFFTIHKRVGTWSVFISRLGSFEMVPGIWSFSLFFWPMNWQKQLA